ncbi:hypothetical protein LCGC14_0876840 [marine sediment metagenome]|uniref:Uncharacterized protein n=1 Tax=marine sediment metagenome TaxID=412755 RepID=A0A0F9RMQ0_9ZZZZ
MGMIGDRLKVLPCQNWDIGRIICHSDTDTMPGFLACVLHGLSPVIMWFYTVFWAKIGSILHGMLTGQNNYRTVDSVIAQFYRLGRIISIMGHVSVCYSIVIPFVW